MGSNSSCPHSDQWPDFTFSEGISPIKSTPSVVGSTTPVTFPPPGSNLNCQHIDQRSGTCLLPPSCKTRWCCPARWRPLPCAMRPMLQCPESRFVGSTRGEEYSQLKKGILTVINATLRSVRRAGQSPRFGEKFCPPELIPGANTWRTRSSHQVEHPRSSLGHQSLMNARDHAGGRPPLYSLYSLP